MGGSGVSGSVEGGRRLIATAVVVAALIAPAILDRDGFPLATYPMYSQSRGAVVSVPTANGVTAFGQRVRLSLQIIGDSDDPLIVTALMRDIVAAGEPASDSFCFDVANRAAAAGTDVEHIELVTETHDVVDHTLGQTSLVSRQVHASCQVGP